MSSHNWPSVQIGQPQYPPFNPNTASYATDDTESFTSDLINPALTSPISTYHLNPEHDINGAGGMIGLTLDQYKTGHRASIAPSIPTPASNKRQLSHDQMMSSPDRQSGDNAGNHQTQPKKRARKGLSAKATLPIPRSRTLVLGESVFSPEDFAAGLKHFKKISTDQSLEDDHLRKMRDFLTWGEDEQSKWLAKLSPEQFGVVLFAEKQDRDHQQSAVAQLNSSHAIKLQNHDATPSFGIQQQGNGVHNGAQYQHAQNVMDFNNLSNFNQQFSPLAQNANFQQMAMQNPQGQPVQFGSQIPSFIVCPSGQLIPQQQNMFENMPTMAGYQSSNMQTSGAYQQQIKVNGQLMTVNLQPAFGGHQNGNFNLHQLTPGALGHVPQQYGTNVNQTFNSMGQQNSTTTYSLPSGRQLNNTNQGENFVLPTLSHAARVAEAQLRAATMRRQHADLRARGLPVPNVPNYPKLPPMVMSGPGLGNLQGAINNLPSAPPSFLINAFDGVNWEKDPEKDAAAKAANGSPPNNSLGGHTPTGDGFPMKFADISGANPVFLSQKGNAVMIDIAGRPTEHGTSPTAPKAVGYHGVNTPVVPFYQVQLPNSAGQLSIGPNAQGSTSPAGAAKGTATKTSPKSKKTTTKKKSSAASSSASSCAIANVASALFPTSIPVPSTSQAIVGAAQPNASFPIVQNPGYSNESQVNPISLNMPAPVSAITRSAVESLTTKLTFPPLPSPESSPVATSSSSSFDASASQASSTTTAQTTQPTISPLDFPESNMQITSSSSDLETASEPSAVPPPGSTDETNNISASTESELTTADNDELDDLFGPIATPELEPSASNEAATPDDSQPTDFNNDPLDGFFNFLDTPGIAPNGEYVGVGVYDETQPVGHGFSMTGGQFDSMADVDFTDMDFSDMGFDNWTDFDIAQ
ncbi:hypothetical protein V499_06450 [Pseudogymnoascus sp. VKM F-103]|nr:hypothetical protein V499_06450 [Pseudogymnoascus sp. VKM F-103]